MRRNRRTASTYIYELEANEWSNQFLDSKWVYVLMRMNTDVCLYVSMKIFNTLQMKQRQKEIERERDREGERDGDREEKANLSFN